MEENEDVSPNTNDGNDENVHMQRPNDNNGHVEREEVERVQKLSEIPAASDHSSTDEAVTATAAKLETSAADEHQFDISNGDFVDNYPGIHGNVVNAERNITSSSIEQLMSGDHAPLPAAQIGSSDDVDNHRINEKEINSQKKCKFN